MSPVLLLILLVIVGMAAALLPIEARYKTLIFAVICLLVVVWLLNAFGLLTGANFRLR